MAYLGYVVKSFVEEKVNEYFKDIPRYVIEIGVFEGSDNNRYEYETKENKNGEVTKKAKTQKDSSGSKVKIQSGVTNAEIMFIMEYGSPTNNIPARPVLQKTIDYAKKYLVKKAVSDGVQRYLMTHDIKDFEKELEKMCMRMENYAKTGIRRGTFIGNDFPPNAPYTIKMKGSDLPLLDTGQLSKAIKCIYRRA